MRLLWVSALIFTVPSSGELMVSLNSQMSTCLYCHENLPYIFTKVFKGCNHCLLDKSMDIVTSFDNIHPIKSYSSAGLHHPKCE